MAYKGHRMSITETLDFLNSRTADEISADRFRLIADKIAAEPSLLEIPLANIARWMAQGHRAGPRLEDWRKIIANAKTTSTGMGTLLALLRDQSAEALFLKGFSPFPGILTDDELKGLSWNSRH